MIHLNTTKSGASATMLLGTTFREWKGWTFEMNATRKYEGLLQDHELSERKFPDKFFFVKLRSLHVIMNNDTFIHNRNH